VVDVKRFGQICPWLEQGIDEANPDAIALVFR
jgi:hypothetical protein